MTHGARRWVWPMLALLLLGSAAASRASDEPAKAELRLYQELGLSEQQTARLTALQSRIEAQDRQLQRQLKDRREELEALYRGYDLDERHSRRVRQEIRDVQEQLLQLHDGFQVELRQIMSRSQFERLQQGLHERESRERRRERRRPERDK